MIITQDTKWMIVVSC